jgi:hypothetical protein
MSEFLDDDIVMGPENILFTKTTVNTLGESALHIFNQDCMTQIPLQNSGDDPFYTQTLLNKPIKEQAKIAPSSKKTKTKPNKQGPKRPYNKKKRSSFGTYGKWSAKEEFLYESFLKEYQNEYPDTQVLREKKRLNYFVMMSEYIGTRTPAQCKSHDQKKRISAPHKTKIAKVDITPQKSFKEVLYIKKGKARNPSTPVFWENSNLSTEASESHDVDQFFNENPESFHHQFFERFRTDISQYLDEEETSSEKKHTVCSYLDSFNSFFSSNFLNKEKPETQSCFELVGELRRKLINITSQLRLFN